MKRDCFPPSKREITLEQKYNFRIKVGNVQMVCLAISIKILKLSAYQNQVNQELPMAAMLLMDKDNIMNTSQTSQT
jgi:hypothetical protein